MAIERQQNKKVQALAPKVDPGNRRKSAQLFYQRICEYNSHRDSATAALCQHLWLLKNGDLYREIFPSWEECVESAGLHCRKADYLISIYDACTKARVDVETAISRAGGWSKLALVADRLTQDNAEKILAEARTKSYRELEGSESKPGADGLHTFSCRVTSDQKAVIERGFAKAMSECHGERTKGFLLEMIIADYLAGPKPKKRNP